MDEVKSKLKHTKYRNQVMNLAKVSITDLKIDNSYIVIEVSASTQPRVFSF